MNEMVLMESLEGFDMAALASHLSLEVQRGHLMDEALAHIALSI